MSTIVVVRKGDEVAIGADTMTRYGDTKQSAKYIRNSSKILRVGDSYFAIVGYAAWDLVLAEHFADQKTAPKLGNPLEIFTFARKLHAVLKKKYFVNPKEEDDDPVESSQMDCLIANAAGIFGLYSLRTVSEFDRFYALGSGFKLALGGMHAVYDRSRSAESVARAGLEAAAEFDDATGDPFEIHSVRLKTRRAAARGRR